MRALLALTRVDKHKPLIKRLMAVRYTRAKDWGVTLCVWLVLPHMGQCIVALLL